MGRARSLVLAAAMPALACLPDRFEALSEDSPVTTIGLGLPEQVELSIALTVAADDEGRGRVLFAAGPSLLGWYQLGERGGRLRFATPELLAQLGMHDAPQLTGLAVVETKSVAEGLVRVAAHEGAPDRIVRFRVADFSRPSAPELDMLVYPWVADPAPALHGPLAAVQLDDGLSEALSSSEDGLFIWDALGTRASEYAAARALVLAEDPSAFDHDPSQGFALTHCPELRPSAIAGGRLLADQRRAAAVLEHDRLTFVGPETAAQHSVIGAPIYACELATLALPSGAASLLVVDLDYDGNEDLLVGAPASNEVWLYENHGDGLPPTPTLTLQSEERGGFGSSLAHVELGGDAPDVLVVGAPSSRVEGKANVGRVYVFARDGELLTTLADLEPRTNSRHGLGVHGLDLPGREELVVSGARELRIHWTAFATDPRP